MGKQVQQTLQNVKETTEKEKTQLDEEFNKLRPTLEKYPQALKSVLNETQNKVRQQDTILREVSDHKDLYLKHIQSLTGQFDTNI